MFFTVCASRTEGGIREIGLVEAPWLIKANVEAHTYPMATMDLMATLLDLLNMKSYQSRPLDGHCKRTQAILTFRRPTQLEFQECFF